MRVQFCLSAAAGLLCATVSRIMVALCIGVVCSADDTQSDVEPDGHREAIREWMQQHAEGTTVRIHREHDKILADLVEEPVFRYADALRDIPDATLWVWTKDSRPVALQKVEVDARTETKQWTICFASLSEDLINVEWPPHPLRRTYESTAPGVDFAPIPDADAPPQAARVRTRQMKRLAERFGATLNLWEGGDTEIRIISTPIFEYHDANTELPIGAIFGMTATGTNPDVLLVIEAREDAQGNLRWEYASARMTTGGVRLRLDDEVVSQSPRVAIYNTEYENWTFHFLPRRLELPSGDESPTRDAGQESGSSN